MKRPSLLRLSDAALLREFSVRLAKNLADSAELLAYLAEIDRRKLYRPAGYSSMYRYCVGHFHFSEGAAYKRILAARLIRKLPAVYDALAEGRVHLSGLVILVTHLKPETVDDLLALVTHKSRREIEKLLAERFPKPDVRAAIREVAATPAAEAPVQLSPAGVPAPTLSDGALSPDASELGNGASTGAQQEPLAARPVTPMPSDRARVMPLSPKTYAVQFTMDEATHDMLRRAQELLGRQVAHGDIAAVFSRALMVYVPILERRKFAASDKPSVRQRPTKNASRHVPARVKRAVWERDGGQCTFVSETGHRCEERTDLEYDHVREFARGGKATVDGTRLSCRAHNQLRAERTFGAGFMQQKRDQAIASRRGGDHELSPGTVLDTGVTQ